MTFTVEELGKRVTTNSTCLCAWNHDMALTPAGYAYTEGEHRRPRNPMRPLTLQKMMTDFRIPVANIPTRVKLSRSLLILSLCAILAAFGSQNTDAPAQRHSSVAVRTGNKTTRDTAVTPAGRSFHRQSSVFLGVEAADAHSGKERHSYAAASREGNNGWKNRPAVYGGQHTPHTHDENRSVPSHLITRAAIEEALSALEDRSHRGAAARHSEHSLSTTHEAVKHFLSYGNVAHGLTEGNTHVGVYSGGLVGDDAVERGPHYSHEQWTEEHAETNEDVEHTEVPADPTHRVRRRHRVYDGSKSKTPAEVFNQYDSLLTVIDGPDSPEKGVSVGSEVLEAVAEPIMPSHEAELEVEHTGALQRGESRLLGLQPIAVFLTAVLVALALMLAHSQSDAGKDFFQQTLLPGRRQSRDYVSHPMVKDRAGHHYFEDGYIADPGEDGAGQQADWMQRGDDETIGAPFDNDFRIREIEQRVIRLDADKDERLKNSTMASLQTPAYRAEQAESTEGLREPFTVPAGAAETLYKDKSEYHNFADNSSNGALQTERSEDDEVSGHHG